MTTSDYFNCENCLWYGNCQNETLEFDVRGRLIGGACSDYSPIDDNDEITLYKADLDMRADLYYSLVEEFQ